MQLDIILRDLHLHAEQGALSLQLVQIQGRQNQSNSDFYGIGDLEWQQYKGSIRYYRSKMCYVPAFLLLQDIKEMISHALAFGWPAAEENGRCFKKC